ncbi:MAG TPA: DUF6677 family protein [Candidatus Acidoferrales bacterium]
MTGQISETGLKTKFNATLPFPVAIAAWIVPGLGHALLRCWPKALVFFLAAAGLAIAGCELRGEVFSWHSGGAFGSLGFIADAGSGICYFAARILEAGGPDISRAAGDYGTRFIAAAGIVNLLGVLDAYGMASGRRN